MRFEKAKKQAIVQYILEKMQEGEPEVIKHVCTTFSINQNTVHAYINELIADGVIKRVKRGRYELLTEQHVYSCSRQDGGLQDEQRIFDEKLSRHFKALSKNVKEIWDYILGEMINNVIDHSCAEKMGVVVRQNYLKTQVFILDDGIGIFKKIKEHFAYGSLEDAICELFKGKLTTDPANHSGEGIFFSSRMADGFAILSDGKFFVKDKYSEQLLRDAPQAETGTAVLVELANSSNKIASEIFNQYAQLDGGFTITSIPLKNIFETAPVSRSQAKRVCQRLENFKEVILDFQGLDWMGQGFAHQLFVVFQNNNPGLLLKPVNMSPGVAQMYSHVAGGKA